MNRLKPSEITAQRLVDALLRRVKNIPARLAWSRWSKANRSNRGLLNSYHNLHAGERCFILGNGPSLAKTNFDLLKSEITFGLNRVYLLKEEFGFLPTYFVSINDLILSQFSEEIMELEMPKFLNWSQRNRYRADQHANFIYPKFGFNDSFQPDIRQQISSGGTVTFAAMQIAYFMGFSEVVLLGVDHSFIAKGTPNETEQREQAEDVDHFHPDYFPKGSKWQLPDLLRSELAYQLAKEAFEADGRTIKDATVGGRLTVFPKTTLEAVIDQQ